MTKQTEISLQAVIFDMDGLMVDTEPLARASWDRIVEPYGGPVSDDLYLQMLGLRTSESVNLVLADRTLPWTADELLARKTAVFLASLTHGVPTMPGLYELLDKLDTLNLPWGVATSSPRDVAGQILRQLGLQERCSALAGGDEVENGKPAPDIYLLAAERLGVAPQHCLALEDTETGCRAAAAAGMHVIAVPGEMTADGVFECADHRFESLADVAVEAPSWLNTK